jgi:hypothetical protein
MDTNIQKALTDKLYDKRKAGAFEYARLFLICRNVSRPQVEACR